MTYLAAGIQHRLQQAFNSDNITLSVNAGFIIAENSQDQTEAKIRQIVENAGFCPLISANRLKNNFLFTVVPYRIPDFFRGSDLLQPSAITDQVKSTYRTSNEYITDLAARSDQEYRSHFAQNKSQILSCARGLTGEALILGLGNGDDIPLHELACQFDRITVIDIDLAGMQKAIAKLSPDLQHKFIPVQKDLTGILPFLSERLENLNVPQDESLAAVAEIIHESIALKPPLSSSKKYHFVVSSMLTTQLFSQMHAYIMEVLPKKYPSLKVNEQSCPNFTNSIETLMKHVCCAHMENLSDWTLPDGKIYYADTTHAEVIEIEFGLLNSGSETRAVIMPKLVNKLQALPNEDLVINIERIFTRAQEDRSWTWRTLAPTLTATPYPRCVRPGNQMTVVARCLQPKK